MDELIARVTAAAGIDPEMARKAVGIIFAFMKKEGPAAEVQQVMDKVPGAEALAAEHGGGGGGLLGGLMGGGGGLMALAGKLTGAGLGMGEMQAVGKQVFAYAREKAGEDTVGEIAGAIPGLGQFI